MDQTGDGAEIPGTSLRWGQTGDHHRGQVAGAALRKPKQGYHANFANSEALKTRLSEREQAAMDELCPWMVSQGIHFSGLDFIGGYLTEINITCPTGIVQISELEDRDLAGEIVDYFSQLVSLESQPR